MDVLKHLQARLAPYLAGAWPLLVVGFSGGRDSLALLYALRLLQRRQRPGDGGDFALLAAHFDHGLRGAESDGDREFCGRFCQEQGIEFCWGKAAGLLGCADQENQARRQRYGWLEGVCQAEEAKGYAPVWLLTAHHQEDQAETVLLHLLRGSGGGGLAAMRERRGRLLRPWLKVSRQDIEAFLQEHNLQWREDSSNLGNIYTRNRLRHEIMPRLQELNPQAAAVLTQTAEIAAAEEDFLQAAVRERLELAALAGGEAAYPLAAWQQEPLAMQRRLARALWRQAAGLAGEQAGALSFEQTERLVQLPLHKTLHLPRGVAARKSRDWLRLWRLPEAERQRRAAKSRQGQQA